MAKGLHHYVRETWKKPKEALPHMFRQTRMAQWRREPVNCRIERPTRLDAARRLGYKAKQGVVLIRTRVRRGGLRKGKIHMKRKPSKAGISKITMAKGLHHYVRETWKKPKEALPHMFRQTRMAQWLSLIHI